MVALLVIMAQIGCHLPCDSATLGIVDYVGTRFGASDELARGRSVSPELPMLVSALLTAPFYGQTFMVELSETSEILKTATSRSLIVLDELGRGTSTNDGLAVAHAVLRHIITDIKAHTLFITHFPQLAELANRYPAQCRLFRMAYLEEDGMNGIPQITFLYKIQ